MTCGHPFTRHALYVKRNVLPHDFLLLSKVQYVVDACLKLFRHVRYCFWSKVLTVI